MKKRNLLLTFVLLLFAGASFAQGLVQGIVKDANTDETLIGASVVIEATTIGITSNLDGSFILIVPEGEHNLVVSYIGYEEVKVNVTVKDGSTYNVGTVLMKSNSIGLDEVNVLASVAIPRKTPVAVSTISAKTVETEMGHQEFPEVMKNTPNVYATKTGGGFGDGRVNVRGFNQSNVAVMINGIPVNDMENGWVYWSNWAGLGDATRTIQVQRGLGASKLAINSVGGTINIVTKTSDANKGGSLKMSVSDFGRFKTMLSLSTGRLKSGTAVTFVGSRTTGKGYVDATYVDAWSYFLSVSQEIGKDHQLVFTMIGAPQKHGQRDGFYMMSQEKRDELGIKYNQNWGYRGGEMLNVRENYYHKPQMSMNWYWNINEKSFLATSGYLSFGTGGGSGSLGYGSYKYEPPQTPFNQYDFDEMGAINAANIDTANATDLGMYTVDEEDTTYAARSQYIHRNSVNNHIWMGILSTFNHEFNDKWSLMAGIDGRRYIGEHYRELRDLMGGDYWSDYAFGARTKPGDKLAYWNDGVVVYAGAFAQGEFTSENFDAFLSGTISNTWTTRIDYYNYTPGEGERSETLSNIGYNVKAGFNFNINEHHNIFVNGGLYSRVPFFRFHFLNYKNDVNPDLQNEKVYAVELGYGLSYSKIAAYFNAYYTIWDDISQLGRFRAEDGTNVNAYLTDLKEVHMGIELDIRYKPAHWVEIGGILGIGSWEYANDAITNLYDDETLEKIGEGITYTKGLKVPDQPQTQVGLNAKFQISKQIDAGIGWLYYANNYAQFTPETRTDPDDRTQSWKIPSYSLIDARAGWAFKISKLDAYLSINCYNLLNTKTAIVEAEDGWDHTQDTMKGFWAWGRTWDFSFAIRF